MRSPAPGGDFRSCPHDRRPVLRRATFSVTGIRPTGGNPARRDVIAHLRDVFNDQTYESLARMGETMSTAEIVTYAYDQIDQARTELEHPS